MGSAPTVLLVEDDVMIRENLRELLELEHYQVVEAANGRIALDYLRGVSKSPSVILLDLNMPVMSGQEFLMTLRKDGGPHSDIPTVIMTAMPEVYETGAQGFIRKPIDLDQLLSTLERVHSKV